LIQPIFDGHIDKRKTSVAEVTNAPKMELDQGDTQELNYLIKMRGIGLRFRKNYDSKADLTNIDESTCCSAKSTK